MTAAGSGSGSIDINLQPCKSPNSPLQQWTHDAKTNNIVLSGTQSVCINIAAYNKSPGSTVWAFNACTASDCKGNCDWESSTGGTLRNQGSGLCLDSTSPPTPPPTMPIPPMPTMRTCAPGSPAVEMPFCDTTKSMAERAAALVANLTLQEKLDTFMLTGQLKGIPRLNVKKFRWDATDIEGVDDQVRACKLTNF